MESRLDPTIRAVDIWVLMQEQTTAYKEQLQLSSIFSGATLHTARDAFGAIAHAAQFCFPSALGAPPIRIICCIMEPV